MIKEVKDLSILKFITNDTMRKPKTCGLLNLLNVKMGISAHNKSVPIIKLINVHKPKSFSEI